MTTTKKEAPTPGPWDYFVGNANGRGLIRIEQFGTGVHIASMQRGAVSEANARLIAAAPELLEILAPFIEIWSRGGSDYNERMNLYWGYDNLSKARAAIAKVTGGV